MAVQGQKRQVLQICLVKGGKRQEVDSFLKYLVNARPERAETDVCGRGFNGSKSVPKGLKEHEAVGNIDTLPSIIDGWSNSSTVGGHMLVSQ